MSQILKKVLVSTFQKNKVLPLATKNLHDLFLQWIK